MPQVFNQRNGNAPQDAIYVGRPSKFGNPFVIGQNGATRDDVVKRFEEWLLSDEELLEAAKQELAGKDLICWCAPESCHADVLLKYANIVE